MACVTIFFLWSGFTSGHIQHLLLESSAEKMEASKIKAIHSFLHGTVQELDFVTIL